MTLDAAALLALPPRTTQHSFTPRDTILYALGVGAGADPDDLPYVYEVGLQALPTMAAILAYPGFWQKEPKYGIDWRRALHAEQSITLHALLPVGGDVRSEMVIASIVDKGAGKGALLCAVRTIYGPDDTLLATVRQTSFLRGDGGCGSGPKALPPPHAVPADPADAAVALPTRPEQALIYRLSGDYNPLHADPAAATAAGLPAPILHGLCTYGIVGRALVRLLCDCDAARLRRIDCRFTAPVFPGETIETAVWREGDGRAAFRASVAARGTIVINNGYAEYDVG